MGTGFSQSFLTTLHEKLQKIERKTPPVTTRVKDIIWVKPKIISEIKYLEFTDAGILRSPVFLHLRPDKNPSEITFKDQELKV